MIARIIGEVLEKNPPSLLLLVGGIGYEILCPMSSFYKMNEEKILSLHTHLSIKEDSHTLYGFISQDEKTLFRELIRVSGIGPKVALAILSHLEVGALINAISNEDDALLAKTPGIGKKTAQKLIVELKDRLGRLNLSNTSNQSYSHTSNQAKASEALQALGFKTKEAEKMLANIDVNLTTERIIRLALQNK
jgi:Holliday junction DNA helicase RuvA